MILFKKVISLFLIGLYLYNQSVFSHLLIIDQHHEVTTVAQKHIHESGETHEHINKAIESCKDSTCESTCKNIETVKLTSHQVNKLLGEIEEQYGKIHLLTDKSVYISTSNNNFSYYSVPIGPPIPIQELMPRVGPVVRII